MKRLFATAAALALLAACSDTSAETTPEQEPTTPAEATTTEETNEPTDEPAEEATEEETAEPEPEPTEPAVDTSTWSTDEVQTDGFPDLTSGLIPTAQRYGSHDSYDRIVIDFEPGEGHTEGAKPQWHARYDAAPIYEGRGDNVDLGAATYLWVTLSGVTIPWEDVEGYTIDEQGADGSTIITAIETMGAWEGMSDIYIGLSIERPYRIDFLSNPDRLVIDIAK